jgi:hypothetical protein
VVVTRAVKKIGFGQVGYGCSGVVVRQTLRWFGLARVQPVDARTTVLGAVSSTEMGQEGRQRLILLPFTTAALQDLVLQR